MSTGVTQGEHHEQKYGGGGGAMRTFRREVARCAYEIGGDCLSTLTFTLASVVQSAPHEDRPK